MNNPLGNLSRGNHSRINVQGTSSFAWEYNPLKNLIMANNSKFDFQGNIFLKE